MQERGSANRSDRRLRSSTLAAQQPSTSALSTHQHQQDRAQSGRQKRRQQQRAQQTNATDPVATINDDPTLGAGRLTATERDALLAYYYDVDQPYALTSSAHQLHQAMRQRIPSLTIDKCKFFLQSQSPYTLTAPHRRPEPSNPMEVYRCYELLACDIMVLREYSDSSDTLRYCLLVVDVFSRYCWDLYLKTRSAQEIVPKFDQLLESMGDRLLSTIVYFDQEAAIKGHAFRAMLKRHNVLLQLSYTKTKVSNAERLIRTLKKSLLPNVCIKASFPSFLTFLQVF